MNTLTATGALFNPAGIDIEVMRGPSRNYSYVRCPHGALVPLAPVQWWRERASYADGRPVCPDCHEQVRAAREQDDRVLAFVKAELGRVKVRAR